MTEGGINVEEAVERFMGKEALFVRFLTKFPDDVNYEKLEKAIEAGNAQEALNASHTLKGVCGNLSMSDLYRLFSEQTRLFRAEDWDGAVSMMPEIKASYEKAVAAIQEGIG